MLNIEDVKVGDELVCIDRDGFNDSHRHNSTLTEFKVCKVGDLGVCINDGDWIIEIEELKYFKKKEQSQYTFDDLIDMAVQAKKDKLIGSINICENYIAFEHGNHAIWYGANRYQDGIDFIQSLYKETFVIESKDDCKRIKQNAKITFLNSNSVVMDQPPVGDGIVRIWNDGRYDFTVLKGATVEQERGRDD